ncbi:uncharacterized protein LOC110833571 isoform X2 [Zootermopsis nevadensis]|uniref:C-factor n=1 Tax=Zootermopsis nevadensis TaxID=136037 RepID=A0A067RA50_ZOONE|nr:uncharacterized protein LOC110833571 isoform X2 [Zootermopsis nevadensis]KDR15459.1 hypothetical protein L798_09164 [Zootermopsis nevadensis]
MKSVLITGSNRGIGLELVKKLTDHVSPPKIIIAACRNPDSAQDLQEFSKTHKNVHIIQLDMTQSDTFDKTVQEVENIVGDEGLNVLINNAGILKETATINDITAENLTLHYLTNTVGPIMLTKAFIPLLKKAAAKNSSLPLGVLRAAVINVTSVLGSISQNTSSGSHGYRESKAALNMATRSLSVELKGDGILATVIHPGWVKTDMGGQNANLTVEISASNIVKTLYSLTEKQNAGFVQYDGKELPW